MKPMIVPTQIRDSDSYVPDFIDMIYKWDRKTGENKELPYFFLIFLILSSLGEDFRCYDFFTPFRDWNSGGDGFNYDQIPTMTKEYYVASFNTVAYVFNKVHEKSQVPKNTLVYGVSVKVTKDFKLRVINHDSWIDRYKKIYESGRSLNQKGIGESLKKMQSDQYLFNLKNQLQVWEELARIIL